MADAFKSRLPTEWLMPFCEVRGLSPDGFDLDTLDRLSPIDANDFMQALDSGLVVHRDGVFTAPCSKAQEQIFWEGLKSRNPRRITLWHEPIITIAGLMRLHRDFGWPVSCLGMQSRTWAFDLAGYETDRVTERLVGEVKKSQREVDALVALIGKHPSAQSEATFTGAERNAVKKVIALRESASTVFWALGPHQYQYVFRIQRAGSAVGLCRADESALVYAGAQLVAQVAARPT